MFNHAITSLNTRNADLNEWTELLRKMFELEEELLIQAVDDESLMDNCRFDNDKIEVIDIYLNKVKETREKLSMYRERLHELLTRLGKTEATYNCYYCLLRDSMDNKYYGENYYGEKIFLK